MAPVASILAERNRPRAEEADRKKTPYYLALFTYTMADADAELLSWLAKAAPEEAKAILEGAMLSYTEVVACPFPPGPSLYPLCRPFPLRALCLLCPVRLLCVLSLRFCVRFDGFLC